MKAQEGLNHSRKAWAGQRWRWRVCILNAASVLLTAVYLCAPAYAAPAARENAFRLVYDVYAGGIHAVEADLRFEKQAGNRYSIVLAARTLGFLHALAPWEGTFESYGWIKKDGHFQPELHRSTATWREEEEIKEYRYGRDGSFKGLWQTQEAASGLEQTPVDPEITKNTTDILAAALNVFREVALGKPCAGRERIFDGKRRFWQVFSPKDSERLSPTRYNIFKGEAQSCAVEVIPDGGEWSKKPRGWLSIQEQGRERGLLPTLWVARVDETGPVFPVKIQVKTAYGTLFMHLASYVAGDGPGKAASP